MSGLSISDSAVSQLRADVARHAARPAETGGFLLARTDSRERLDVVALAGEAGVRRSRDVFRVSATAIERLFVWAADNELLIRAQVHSHRGNAFLSRTDLRHGFAVAGFITAVIPTYTDPPWNLSDWGWWFFDAGRWRAANGPTVSPGAARVVRFDEAGIGAL